MEASFSQAETHGDERTADEHTADEHTAKAAPEPSGGSGPRPLADILEDLARPIPERLLETRRLQGQEITYIPWYRAQKILNHYTRGQWEYRIVERAFTPERAGEAGRIMLTVRIIIHAAEGPFHREGTGIERLDVEPPGDPQSNAESQAFRRACARWGLGLGLYEGDA